MNFGLALEIDQSLLSKADVIWNLDAKLSQFFRDRNYGEDLQMLSVGVVLTGPDGNKLHPVRPLKFKKKWTFRPTPKSEAQVFTNIAEYDIKPDYETFARLNHQQGTQYLSRLVLESVDVLAVHRKKFPDFDLERFKVDLEKCLALTKIDK